MAVGKGILGAGRYFGFQIQSLRDLVAASLAEIISLEPNQSFTDLMLKGIYRAFRHTHEFKSPEDVPV